MQTRLHSHYYSVFNLQSSVFSPQSSVHSRELRQRVLQHVATTGQDRSGPAPSTPSSTGADDNDSAVSYLLAAIHEPQHHTHRCR